MKNIHLLPTDKPSTLSIIDSELVFSKEYFINPQHIYITSDEEIKEGDWFITKTNDVLKVQKPEKSYDPIGKKIILTTDQDLIKDEVQAIDDEFLEWLVQNPSREFVEINIPQEEPKLINNCPKCGLDLVEREGSKPVCNRVDCGGIILSNETLREWELKKEPKQEIAGKAFYESADKVIIVKRQETLEEAAKNYAEENDDCYTNDYYGFINGAKWKEEQMHSDKIINILDDITYWDNCPEEYKETISFFIKQFKKK